MTLSTVNRSFEKIGRGEFYLAALPAASVFSSCATQADYVKKYFEQFYTTGTGDTLKALTAGVKPYASLTSDGLKVKVKQNPIDSDPNSGPKHTVGIQDTEITFEMGIIDLTPQKLAELASCSTEELIAQAAATGKAGRSQVMVGGQSILTPYVGMYRMPSTLVPGEFDHILMPRINVVLDTDFDFNKKSVLSCKVKGTCLQEAYGLVNAAGFPEQMIYDIANAAAV